MILDLVVETVLYNEIKEEQVEYIQEIVLEERESAVVGRDQELQSIIDILCRARRCHVAVVGEMGTGCSSLLEESAQQLLKIARPSKFQQGEIKKINFIMLLTEPVPPMKVLNDLLQDIEEHSKPVLLILDELDILFDYDEAITYEILNWLKRALFCNSVQLFLSCNQHFYRQYLFLDKYLMRHFSPIMLSIPQAKQAELMLKVHLKELKETYSVDISEKVLSKIIFLAERYVCDIKLPTSALNLLDIAAAHANRSENVSELNEEYVVEVLSKQIDRPSDFLLQSEKDKIMQCAKELRRNIFGQDVALETIEQTLQAKFLNLNQEKVSLVTMLFVGPKGVGKCSTAKELTKLLYGSKRHLFCFNMEEYKTQESMEKLLGEYEAEGFEGELIHSIRCCPFSICLFENIELAHEQFLKKLHSLIENKKEEGEDCFNAIFVLTTSMVNELPSQSLSLSDSESNESNLLQLVIDDLPGSGSQHVEESERSHDALLERIEPLLEHRFGEEVLQRWVLVPFRYLSMEDLVAFAERLFHRFANHLRQEYGVSLHYDNDFIIHYLGFIPNIKQSPGYIKHRFKDTIVQSVSQIILNPELKGVKEIVLSFNDEGEIRYREK